jgi:pseudouridine synthase
MRRLEPPAAAARDGRPARGFGPGPGRGSRQAGPQEPVPGTAGKQAAAPVRLNKFLAHAGVFSRREADRAIEDGRVSVNGRAIDELGLRIDPARDRVNVDGRLIRAGAEGPAYILLYKPRGSVVTVKDPLGRPTVMDLLPRLPVRVYPVGRLDAASEGVLLLTNDGATALRLMHPRYGVDKTYEVRVDGAVPEEDVDKLRKGIFLEGRRTAPARVHVMRRGRGWTLVQVVIHEGRKREIRKMFESLGFAVAGLLRVRFDGLTLDGLKPGQWRYLKKEEIEGLKKPGR